MWKLYHSQNSAEDLAAIGYHGPWVLKHVEDEDEQYAHSFTSEQEAREYIAEAGIELSD